MVVSPQYRGAGRLASAPNERGTAPAVHPATWRDAPRKRLLPTRRPPGGGQKAPTIQRDNFRNGNRPASPGSHRRRSAPPRPTRNSQNQRPPQNVPPPPPTLKCV